MSDMKHALYIVGLKVLEDWGMMMVDPAQAGLEIFNINETLYHSSTRFQGVMNGRVSIIAQRGFLDTLADNLLGIDEDTDAGMEQRNDAFKEMANVLSGNFLTEAYGDDTVFDVVLPAVDELSQSEAQNLMNSRVVFCFLADQNPVAITFDVE